MSPTLCWNISCSLLVEGETEGRRTAHIVPLKRTLAIHLLAPIAKSASLFEALSLQLNTDVPWTASVA